MCSTGPAKAAMAAEGQTLCETAEHSPAPPPSCCGIRAPTSTPASTSQTSSPVRFRHKFSRDAHSPQVVPPLRRCSAAAHCYSLLVAPKQCLWGTGRAWWGGPGRLQAASEFNPGREGWGRPGSWLRVLLDRSGVAQARRSPDPRPPARSAMQTSADLGSLTPLVLGGDCPLLESWSGGRLCAPANQH